VARLLAALDQFNGALLCDEVGMGKTYVATAIAQRFSRCLVIAPAALVSMWRDALTATGIVAEIMTFEALSRVDSADSRRHQPTVPEQACYDLIIVDEAHHARNPSTNRYFALASLTRGARVLLLTATPIHNRRADLVALLSLFLGSRARAMTSAELALCVVRRDHAQIAVSSGIPAVTPTQHHQLPDSPGVVDQLMNLPPPLPVRDGGLGGSLIGRGLVHQWASSEAALLEAVRRRIARALALSASLEAGTYPTARELEIWTYGEGALQLGFPELLSPLAIGHAALLETVRAHLRALQKFLRWSSAATTLDAERARIVAEITKAHAGAKIVAFAQYSETVSMLFRQLCGNGRAAMLTSHGARIAGGALSRSEAIGRFAPRASHFAPTGPAEAIDLLITTDLLSEGVNLQDAEVVVHLDIPWTLARMEQRVGRAARMGSRHAIVHVHLLRPPRSAAAVLDNEMIVQRKWDVARSSVGTSAANPLSEKTSHDATLVESAPAKTERLRSILESWLTSDDESYADDTLVATVSACDSGFIAAISAENQAQLLVAVGDDVSAYIDAQIEACTCARGEEVATDSADYERAIRTILSWHSHESASAAAGVGGSSGVQRKHLTNRIDSAIQRALPHLRSARAITAARARRVATTQQSAAVERELEALMHSDVPDDEWLEAVAGLESGRAGPSQATNSRGPARVRAVLLMQRV
jgi:hypothetical protein